MSNQVSPDLKVKRRSEDKSFPKKKKKCETALKVKENVKEHNKNDKNLFNKPLVIQNEINPNQDKFIIDHPQIPDFNLIL